MLSQIYFVPLHHETNKTLMIMATKKFKLTDDTIVIDGITLHRIKALRSFGNVIKGNLGGWVEK